MCVCVSLCITKGHTHTESIISNTFLLQVLIYVIKCQKR